MTRDLFALRFALIGAFVSFLACPVLSDVSSQAPQEPRQIEALLTDPNILTRDLGDSFHVSIPIKHPTHSQLLFVSFSAIAEQGIVLPEQGMTPPFEARLNNVFLWVTDTTGNPADYIPGSDSEGQADLYGGGGGVKGYGSGRALAVGGFQVKFEKTDLSPNNGDFGHTYGHGPLSRTFSEAIWGDVNQDFPWGSNRVLTVSDRGTYTHWPDEGNGEGWEREGDLTRNLSERPAHVLPILGIPPKEGFSPEFKKKLDEQTAKRVPEGMKNLVNVLPQPANLPTTRTPEEKFKTGTVEFLDRWADNKAFEVANRLAYLSTSPANMEWSGKLIDFDTMTAQPSYMRLKTTAGDEYASNRDFEVEVIEPVFREIHLSAPKNFSAVALSSREAIAHFREKYDYLLARHFDELTGIPRNVLLKLEKEPDGIKLITDLGKVLETTAFHGSQEFTFTDALPEITTTYDLPRILVDLASRNPTDPEELNASITDALPDSELRKQVVDSYAKLMTLATEVSARDGVSKRAFQTLIYDNSKMRNADVPDLNRPDMRWENIKLVDEYTSGGNRSKIWDSITSRIAKSRRVYKADHPYQLVLAENEDALNRMMTRRVFDAKANRYETIVQLKALGGKVSFFGKDIPLKEMAKKKLWSDTDHWKKGIVPSVNGQTVEFKLPANADTTHLSMALGLEPSEIKRSVTFVEKNPLPWHPKTKDLPLPQLTLVPEEPEHVETSAALVKSPAQPIAQPTAQAVEQTEVVATVPDCAPGMRKQIMSFIRSLVN